jgi:hypothetical protein
MRAKTRKDEPVDVRKLMDELAEYENNPRAKGGLKINMPLQDALRRIAKVKPERKAK